MHKIFVLYLLITTLGAGASFSVLPGTVHAATEVTEDITEDTTWSLAGSPYVVRNSIVVDPDVILTIEPGVVVKFAPDGGLDIFGALTAVGTADANISFTTLFDDTIGGDTNGDGSATGAGRTTRGDWSGISLYPSSGVSSLQNIVVNYSDGLYLEGVDITIDGLFMTDNWQDLGIYGGTVAIHNGDLRNTKGYTGIYVYGAANLSIEESMFDGAIQADMIIIDDGSTVNLSSSTFRNIQGQALYITDNSVGRITQTIFDSIADGAIVVSSDSNADFDEVTIKNTLGWGSGGIYAFYNGTVTIKNSLFDTGTYGVLTSDGATVTIENTEIKSFTQAGIMDFGGSTWKMQNSSIRDNDYGIHVYYDGNYPNSTFDAKNNKLYGNTSANAYNDGSAVFTIDLADNYWGDASGPHHIDTNPGGLGGEVSDGITFTPWCIEETCTPPATRDPVIIVPGITGTRLMEGYGDNEEIWPNPIKLATSLFDDFLDVLALRSDGTEDPNLSILLGDIVRSAEADIGGVNVVTKHVFDTMISDLEAAGYVEGTDLFVLPYDWRFSNVANQYLLRDKIDQILAASGKNKVDIIAHSMGGILAKEYVAQNGSEKIDQIFFLGTPHLGAPKAFKTLMWGDDMGFKVLFNKVSILNPNKIKSISQNFSSIYELLPSRMYVNVKNNAYVKDLINDQNSSFDYDQIKSFLVGEGRNETLFPGAEATHVDTDGIDLSGVRVYNFTGCKLPTVGSFTIRRHKLLGLEFGRTHDIVYIDGDETVPLESSGDVEGEQYFIKGVSHGSLPDAVSIRGSVLSLLSGEESNQYDNIIPQEQCGLDGVAVDTHSPVTLHIYDSNGAHTGPNEDGEIEYDIPGVPYDTINDEKFTFLPVGGEYTIEIHAEGLGNYDFYLKQFENGEMINKIYFSQVPITSLFMKAKLVVGDTVSDVTLSVDEDGDGIFEKTVEPSAVLDQSQAADETAPETSAQTIGEVLVLSATDDNAGVLKTEYSLDSGGTWLKYNGSVDVSGKTVHYFSTDKAGNVELVNHITIPEINTPKIDIVKNTNSGPVLPRISIENILPSIIPATDITAAVNDGLSTLFNNGFTSIDDSPEKKQPVLEKTSFPIVITTTEVASDRPEEAITSDVFSAATGRAPINMPNPKILIVIGLIGIGILYVVRRFKMI